MGCALLVCCAVAVRHVECTRRTLASCMCRLHVLCYAALRVAPRRACRIAFIHMPPWIVSQGGYACGCVARVRGARECARVQRALHICCGACGDTLLFRAWGDCASESLGGARRRPHPNPKGRHAPTAGKPDIHPDTTQSLSSLPPTFRVGELPGIPRLHCSAQSM